MQINNTEKEKVLFICEKNLLSPISQNGGVKKCTFEFIELLEDKFDIIYQPIELKNKFLYKVKVKLGIDTYDQYNPSEFIEEIKNNIIENNIKYIFINMSDAVVFSKPIKEIYSDNIKIILISHGNQSGDFLHEAFRFKEYLTFPKNYSYLYKLSRQLELEYYFRLNFIDLVLTVSENEQEIEKYLCAKNTLFIPRLIKKDPLSYSPTLDRVGFFGDLTHFPNFYGVKSICEAIQNKNLNVKLRLVGKGDRKLDEILKNYSFVEYIGYLNNDTLRQEIASWSLFLNLVFYFSKGVSTKLSEVLSWGIPVVSTPFGNRGYNLSNDDLLTVSSPTEMAEIIEKYFSNFDLLINERNNILKLQKSNIDINTISTAIYEKVVDIK